ncbi:hypothetical protein LXL04_028963 [Taraxacum kok-saghyz]
MLRSINMRPILSVVKIIINVNSGNLRFCSGPDFLPVNPSNVNKLYIYGNELNGNSLQICQNRDSRHRQTSQNLKDTKDRPHDTLTSVNILASNSKVSRRYESRKSAYEQRDYRLLRSRAEMAVIPKPELQTTNRRMFWNRHT